MLNPKQKARNSLIGITGCLSRNYKNLFLSAFNPLSDWRLTTIKIEIKSRPSASATEKLLFLWD